MNEALAVVPQIYTKNADNGVSSIRSEKEGGIGQGEKKPATTKVVPEVHSPPCGLTPPPPSSSKFPLFGYFIIFIYVILE